MLIIPAIDLLDNKVVRLTKGDYNEVTYYDYSPVDLATRYENHGFEWLHIIDLAAAKSGNISALPVIKEIKQKTKLKLQFGGGVRNKEQVDELINAGVDRIIIGSLSIQNKDEFENIVSKYGADKFVVAIDSHNENILTKGWTENSGVPIYDHINYCSDKSVTTFLCTDVSKDGTLSGPNAVLYGKIMEKHPGVKLIASGGISSLHDILLLGSMNLYATVVGKAIYENKIKLEDLANIGS
jgi:phosphoribosylformimino-5-aminoimidazole carboxamide ribotide isomerase